MLLALASVATDAEGSDPITALLTRDWAAFGGWSLFIGLGLFLIVSFFRETIVPGARLKRLEESARLLEQANAALMSQNDKLIAANEITKHFFEETTPRRGESRE